MKKAIVKLKKISKVIILSVNESFWDNLKGNDIFSIKGKVFVVNPKEKGYREFCEPRNKMKTEEACTKLMVDHNGLFCEVLYDPEYKEFFVYKAKNKNPFVIGKLKDIEYPLTQEDVKKSKEEQKDKKVKKKSIENGKEISLKILTQKGLREVDGFTFNGWLAYHKSADKPKKFMVTHINTKRVLVPYVSLKKARELTYKIEKKFGSALNFKNMEEMSKERIDELREYIRSLK